jgi:phage baseplate assembly protein W
MINNGMAMFKGFSTIDRVRAPYTLVDKDLIKRDLLNHFYTKKGERLMRPQFGSIIWDLLMNPEDAFTEDDIKQDIERIIDTDPRVELINTTLFILDHTVRAEINLRYKGINDEDVLYVEFVGKALDEE